MKTKRESGLREQSIHQAVLDLVTQGVPLETVSMQDIAQQAGLGKSTLYEYYGSREELLLATLNHSLDQELEILGQETKDCRSFEELLEAIFSYLRGLVKERLVAYHVLSQMISGHSPLGNCPLLGRAQSSVQKLLDGFSQLAEQQVPGLNRTLFQQQLVICLIGHAVCLLRLRNQGLLEKEPCAAQEQVVRQMIFRCLEEHTKP